MCVLWCSQLFSILTLLFLSGREQTFDWNTFPGSLFFSLHEKLSFTPCKYSYCRYAFNLGLKREKIWFLIFAKIACENFQKLPKIGSIFVKIFWWHEILADSHENIYFISFASIYAKKHTFTKVFAKLWVTKQQIRAAAWKLLLFLRSCYYFRENRKE